MLDHSKKRPVQMRSHNRMIYRFQFEEVETALYRRVVKNEVEKSLDELGAIIPENMMASRILTKPVS
jgi:hypothetical protein